MNWKSAADFFDMGGYAVYVWGSYAVAALLMLVEPWLAAHRHAKALEHARHTEEQDSRP
jgi:heme exporter protein D